jgi:hypothetical protein
VSVHRARAKKSLLAPCAVCVALALVIGFAGCGSSTPEPKKPTNARAATAVVKSGGISVSLRSDPAVSARLLTNDLSTVEPAPMYISTPESASGGTFSLTLVVRNLSGKPFSWTSPSGQTYEFLAFDKAGNEVWRWSKGRVFIQIVTQITINPGDSKVYKVAWNTGGTAAGLYAIQGYFLGLPSLRPSVSVEIEP